MVRVVSLMVVVLRREVRRSGARRESDGLRSELGDAGEVARLHAVARDLPVDLSAQKCKLRRDSAYRTPSVLSPIARTTTSAVLTATSARRSHRRTTSSINETIHSRFNDARGEAHASTVLPTPTPPRRARRRRDPR